MIEVGDIMLLVERFILRLLCRFVNLLFHIVHLQWMELAWISMYIMTIRGRDRGEID